MSVQTKKRFKNLGKIVSIGLFTLLMLTNIKLALLDDNEIASGDISLFGIEVNLFDATYACDLGGGGSGGGVYYKHSIVVHCLISTELCCGRYIMQDGSRLICGAGGGYCIPYVECH